MTVLLVGVDYFPFRSISEKNYWHTLLPLVSERLQQPVVVLSVNLRQSPVERQQSGCGEVLVYNVAPARLAGDLPAEGFESTAYLHRFPLGPLRRSLTLRRNAGLLDRLATEHRVQAIHYMDNFGDAMAAAKRRYPRLQIAASLPTWMDRLGRFKRVYHWIRRRSFASLDAVVTPAAATARRMRAAGFPEAQVHQIPWGVVPRVTLDPDARARGRQVLDVPRGAPLLLWSGFTQRSTEDDLLFARRLAQAARAIDPRVYAAFVFKPADLRPAYEAFRDDQTRVLRTNPETFPDVLAAGDLFLSPVTEPGRTVTPPLTWLEAMDLGLPVVSTRAEGAADVIMDGVNGLLVTTPEGGARRVVDLLGQPSALQEMSRAARQLVAERYGLRDIVEAYLRVWHLA